MEGRITNASNAVRNGDRSQVCTAFEGLKFNAFDALWNFDRDQSITIKKSAIIYPIPGSGYLHMAVDIRLHGTSRVAKHKKALHDNVTPKKLPQGHATFAHLLLLSMPE